MLYLEEQIDKWNNEIYFILLLGDFNDYIFRHRSRLFFYRIGPRELIIKKHGSEGPGSTIKKNKQYMEYGYR